VGWARGPRGEAKDEKAAPSTTPLATLPILTYPAKSLKKPSVDVERVDGHTGDFVNDLFATMRAAQGLGLAAPQVGENRNIFVMDIAKPDPIDPDKTVSRPLCMINPKIVATEGVIQWEEGCLSCPDLLVTMDRARHIVVEFLDAEGRPQRINLSELEAVCVQHEMDHLKGVLLADRLSRLKRDLYGKQRLHERKSDNNVGKL
jgi:peptide deformylase